VGFWAKNGGFGVVFGGFWRFFERVKKVISTFLLSKYIFSIETRLKHR
jgi:hypothetical protein